MAAVLITEKAVLVGIVLARVKVVIGQVVLPDNIIEVEPIRGHLGACRGCRVAAGIGEDGALIVNRILESSAHEDVGAIKIPTGLIPEYKDLRSLFKETLGEDYAEEDYNGQFTVRVPEHLAKIDRLTKIYQSRVTDTPQIVFRVLEEQRQRLVKAREKYGDYIKPMTFVHL